MEYIKRLRLQYTLKQRIDQASMQRSLHLDKIPVIVDRAHVSTVGIDRHKYLVPCDLSVAQFKQIIRSHIGSIKPEDALFYYAIDHNVLLGSHELMSVIYASYKHADGFLYITYAQDATFGV